MPLGISDRNFRNYLAQRGEPPTVTSQYKFSQINKSDGTRFSMFHCKRVLHDGEAVDCPWPIYSLSKKESVAITANLLALDVQSYYTKYLISEGTECSTSCIYWLLRCCPVYCSLCWRGETWDMPQTFLSHQRFLSVWRDVPLNHLCTRHWVGPRKVLPIGSRTC